MANLSNPPGGKYFRIHRAICSLPDRSKPGTPNPRTGNRYSKVTGESIADLIAWAKANMPWLKPLGQENYCKICTPSDDSPVEAAPTADFDEYMLRADRLLGRGRVPRPQGVLKPEAIEGTNVVFYRDPAVRAWVLQRAKGLCELCETQAPFVTDDEIPYLESHHIIMLSEGGPDTPSNTAAVCPNCHRNLHYGIDRQDLRDRLCQLVISKEAGAAVFD
jgi:hypothetical protein